MSSPPTSKKSDRLRTIDPYSAANAMDPGPVPAELPELSIVEECLIRLRPIIHSIPLLYPGCLLFRSKLARYPKRSDTSTAYRLPASLTVRQPPRRKPPNDAWGITGRRVQHLNGCPQSSVFVGSHWIGRLEIASRYGWMGSSCPAKLALARGFKDVTARVQKR